MENQYSVGQKSGQKSYPVRFDVAYSEKLNRVTTFFRLILAIPILMIVFLIAGVTVVHQPHHAMSEAETARQSLEFITRTGGILVFPPLLMILFRKYYPRWWFDWNVSLFAFFLRVGAYIICLTDQYPSVADQQKVHLEIDYPQPDQLMRGMPLVKWFLAIPHFIILLIMDFIGLFVIVMGWVCVLFMGRYPKPFFNYLVGLYRWKMRVISYCFIMVTDQYPSFSMKP